MKDKIYKNLIWAGLAFVFVFAPVALGAARWWAITPIELVVLTLIFVWLWRMNNTTGWNFKPTALDLPVWTFVALASISCVFSIYLHDSLFEMKRLLTMVGIYYLIVNNFDKKAIGQFMLLIVMIGAGISLIGLAQYFLNLPHGWWAEERFLTSTYVNHNHFAGYLEMAMPLAVGLFFYEKTALRKILLGCTSAIMAAAFIFAQSRGAWISLAIALCIITFYLSKKRVVRKAIFVIVFLLLLLAFVALYYGESDVSSRVVTMTKVGGDASFLTRVKIWQGTLDMIRHNPLIGTGIGTLRWGFPLYRPVGLTNKIVHAHNDYLHMAAEMGVLALPFMIFMIFVVLKKAFSMAGSPVYAGLTIALLSIFLHSLIDFNLHIPANMLLLSALCAFILIGEEGNQLQ